ncbi:dr1-associated corepressor [Hypomesus transpacificus]|uniref:dr1-associated corepressor n=1 Tax=Hypomesus transpacificus TaxID=137520 RepID=UPI001F0833D0|nr:dr1-associated corepressor [Hypomesus transpacificus]
MPRQKKKYNVRFPPGRIKKIMQRDTEVGKMAAAVPVIISRAVELFVASLLTKTWVITQSKRSRVLSIAHMKQCVESEKLFDFLKNMTEHVRSMSTQGETGVKGKWLFRRKQQDPSAKQHDAGEKSNNNSSRDMDSDLFISLGAIL